MEKRNNKLRLKWDLELPDALIESFDAILDYAIANAHAAEAEPENLALSKTSVHEFRKSIRRARSLLRLVADSQPKIDRTELNEELRAAFAPTSALRDADVLSPILEKVRRLAPDTDLPAQVEVSLQSHRVEIGSHRATSVLLKEVERLHHCKWAIRKLIPKSLDWDDLRRGLARSYRRCSKRRKTVVATNGELLAVHGWRKRTKELRYQTELLASGNAEPVTSVNEAFAELAQALGDVTDLSIFHQFLISKVDAVGVEAWANAVEQERIRQLHACFWSSDGLFTPTPKDFSRDLLKTS